jgi:hypothetical protein
MGVSGDRHCNKIFSLLPVAKCVVSRQDYKGNHKISLGSGDDALLDD